jgi:hypothetical protein
MDSFLQMLGSIASIGSIPLAIFLYVRSREARFNKIKQEIVKILSYQIGEGRNLSVFEINSVISSKIRENGIKNSSIEVDDIIEDLVSETISSPMLESERKKEIISNLGAIHKKGKLESILERNILQKVDLSDKVGKQNTKDEFDKIITSSKQHIEAMERNVAKFSYTSRLSERFAVIASIITIIAFIVSSLGEKSIQDSVSKFFNENIEMVKIGLSIVVTIIAGLITFFFNDYFVKKLYRKKIFKDKKSN